MRLLLKKPILNIAIVTALLFTPFNQTLGQSVKKIDSLDVTSKIEFVIKNSNNYKEFKVVNKTWLTKLKSQVADSLDVADKRFKETQVLIKKQQQEISELKNTITETNTALTNVNSEKDQIAFLGMPLEKGLYNMIMWVMVFILLISLLLFIMKFRTSNKVTRETNKNYESLDSDFEKFKKNTLDKEQKLKRQLQDEINKNSKLSKD